MKKNQSSSTYVKFLQRHNPSVCDAQNMRILQKSSQLSISQYVYPFAESSASQCVLPSVRLPSIIRSFIHSVSQSVSQSASQSVHWSISQSVRQATREYQSSSYDASYSWCRILLIDSLVIPIKSVQTCCFRTE